LPVVLRTEAADLRGARCAHSSFHLFSLTTVEDDKFLPEPFLGYRQPVGDNGAN
jgi:hypothetical protein